MTPQNQTIRGLYVDCYSFEALLKSSLECFYDYSCFQQFVLTNISFTPLNSSLISRFNQSSTIESMIKQLMIEEWFISTSYESYFEE